VRRRSCYGLTRDDDSGCFYSLSDAVLPCDQKQNQDREENEPTMVLQ